MIKLFAIILIILLYLIGGERGLITFVSLFFNVIVLAISTSLIAWGFNPLVVTFISCILICNITLFYQNGKNAKTIASFISVIIVLLILIPITYSLGYQSKIEGLNEILKYTDELSGLTLNINIDMAKVAVSMIIMGLIGAAMDTSMAVSSAVYEIYRNNRDLDRKELLKSGINIGKDILGTTVNTLYFACIGESMMLFILFKNYNYSILKTINSKAFFQEFIYIVFSAIACVLIIPITSIIISYILTNHHKMKKHLEEDELLQ